MQWARESANLTALAASRKLDVTEETVTGWETGAIQPPIAKLRQIAAVYRRSLAVFFLSEPPAGFETLRDFRRVQGAEAGGWSVDLHAEFRRALRQREYLLELFELEDLTPSQAWAISPLPSRDAVLADQARTLLVGAMPRGLPRGTDRYVHLNAWAAALEQLGVLVFATAGGLVKTNEMRALSLYFEHVPVIVVNGADAPRGRLFSLVHEYAHLLLHTEGLCDLTTDLAATDVNQRLEARCNALAAEILMPGPAVLARPEVQELLRGDHPMDYRGLAAAAAPFGVSAEAMLRRLQVLGRVSQEYYEGRREEFRQLYEQDRPDSSGGNFYYTTVRDRGREYVRRVTSAHARRVIDSYTAATFLDVKVNQLQRLAATAAATDAE